MNIQTSYNPTLQPTNPFEKSEMAQFTTVQLLDQLYFGDSSFIGFQQGQFV